MSVPPVKLMEVANSYRVPTVAIALDKSSAASPIVVGAAPVTAVTVAATTVVTGVKSGASVCADGESEHAYITGTTTGSKVAAPRERNRHLPALAGLDVFVVVARVVVQQAPRKRPRRCIHLPHQQA